MTKVVVLNFILWVNALVGPIVGCEVVVVASVVGIRNSEIVMHNHPLELCTIAYRLTYDGRK